MIDAANPRNSLQDEINLSIWQQWREIARNGKKNDFVKLMEGTYL